MDLLLGINTPRFPGQIPENIKSKGREVDGFISYIRIRIPATGIDAQAADGEPGVRLGWRKLVSDLYELSMSDIGALTYRKTAVDPVGILQGALVYAQRFAGKGMIVRADFTTDRGCALFGGIICTNQDSLRNVWGWRRGGGQDTILAAKLGRFLNRDQLMDRIYTDRRIVCDRTIDSHIKKLRKKNFRRRTGCRGDSLGIRSRL